MKGLIALLSLICSASSLTTDLPDLQDAVPSSSSAEMENLDAAQFLAMQEALIIKAHEAWKAT